jgi:ABC-type amino acid transport substrate-binding protein
LKKELGDDLVIRAFPNGADAMQALANQKVDAVIEDNLFALQFVMQHKDMNLVTIETQRGVAQFGIIVRKECPALLTLVNEQLAAIIRDGRYANLYMNFFGVQPPARFRP